MERVSAAAVKVGLRMESEIKDILAAKGHAQFGNSCGTLVEPSAVTVEKREESCVQCGYAEHHLVTNLGNQRPGRPR